MYRWEILCSINNLFLQIISKTKTKKKKDKYNSIIIQMLKNRVKELLKVEILKIVW